jgi:Tfp pilus assembly protein PilO
VNSSRLWTFGSIIVILALVAGTWFIGISPQLAAAAAANDSRATVEGQNARHQIELASLEKQFEEIDELRDELTQLRKTVPADGAMPDMLSELHQLAAANGVAISSVTVADPSTYAPIENTTADPELAAALASVSSGAFLVIPIDVGVSGLYQNVMAFLSSLQNGERYFLVHDINLSTGLMATDVAAEVSLSGQAFVLLDVAPAPLASDPVAGTGAEAEQGTETPQ